MPDSRRHIAKLLLLVGIVGSRATAETAPKSVSAPPDPTERAKAAVLFVHSFLPDSRRATGSGFFVSDTGYALTCRHVIANARVIWVRMADGTTKRATTVAALDTVDLALVKVDVPSTPYISFGDTGRLKEGDSVTVLGYPATGGEGAHDLVTTKGSVLEFLGNRQLFRVDAPIRPGASGGPVLDRSGNAVGVAWADAPGREDGNYAISVNDAWPLLDKTSPTVPMAVYLKLLTPDITKGTVLGVTGRDWVSWKPEERLSHLAGLMAAFNVVRLYVQDYDAALADKKGDRTDGGKWVLNSLKDIWFLPFSLQEYSRELDTYFRDPNNLDTVLILALFTVNQRLTDKASKVALPETPPPAVNES